MAFQFKKASTVAIGTFNIYIIQPAWLTSVGILEGGQEIILAANMTKPGFRLSSPTLKTVWFVEPGKLAIETASESEDCGRLMADVLKHLQWTPVSALGNNVFYQGRRGEIDALPAVEAHPFVVPDDYNETRRATAIALERDGRKFHLNVAMDGTTQIVELVGNAHSDFLEGRKADDAIAAAERFTADKRDLTTLLTDVIGARIDSVTTHS